MKNNAIRMFLALGAACVCVSALDAQPNALAAKVPFAFQVGDKTLPAGTYRVSEYGSTGVPILQNANTGDSIFVAGASHSLDPVRPGRLVFHCYGPDGCFLAEIWPPRGFGSAVSKTRTEKEILKGERSREMATISIDLRRAD